MLCNTLFKLCKKRCLLKSANISFRRYVSGLTPSSAVAKPLGQNQTLLSTRAPYCVHVIKK